MADPDPDAWPEQHWDAAYGQEALAAAAGGWGAAWQAGRLEPAPDRWLSGPREGETR